MADRSLISHTGAFCGRSWAFSKIFIQGFEANKLNSLRDLITDNNWVQLLVTGNTRETDALEIWFVEESTSLYTANQLVWYIIQDVE